MHGTSDHFLGLSLKLGYLSIYIYIYIEREREGLSGRITTCNIINGLCFWSPRPKLVAWHACILLVDLFFSDTHTHIRGSVSKFMLGFFFFFNLVLNFLNENGENILKITRQRWLGKKRLDL